VELRAGIDLGGTKIQAVVVDHGYGVLGQSRLDTPMTGGPADVVDTMIQATREACAGAEVAPEGLAGIGVGSPGDIDDRAGTVGNAVNLPDWLAVFPVRDELQEAFGGVPVSLGNDVQVATDAEHKLGAGRPYHSLLGVFWGTGVGGGIVLDDRAWVGRNAAGEIGHMVVRIGGERCGCGRKGCVEAYAGRGSMERRARRRVKDGERTELFKIMKERQRTRLASGVWARALKREDGMAVALVDDAIEALGAGIASACNLLDVEAVIIGGGLGIRLGEPAVERIRAAMLPHLFTDDRPPAVHLAALGDLGGALGGALLSETATAEFATASTA
jgi:glucokinase